MKNVKKMVAAGTMIAAMVFGTTLANAGIIIAKEKPNSGSCSDSTTTTLEGLIATGIIIAKTGIIIAKSDQNSTCRYGIIIA